jgi:O-antigen ligase
MIQTRKDLMFIVILLVLGLGLQSGIMLFLKATGGTLDLGILAAEPDAEGRLSGTVGGPNQSADFLVMWLALSVSLLFTRVPSWVKVIAVMAFLGALPPLLFTYSRGGWIACALAITLIGLVAWWRGWVPLYIPFIAGLLAITAAVLAWPIIVARIFGDDGGSAEARWPLMHLALLVIRDHPFFGVGANNLAIRYPDYLTSEFSGEWIKVVHNKFLLVWSEIGTVGFVAFVWFLCDTLVRGWRVIQKDDPYLSPLALALTAAIAGMIVHMQVSLFHDRIQVLSLFLASALIFAMQRLSRTSLR